MIIDAKIEDRFRRLDIERINRSDLGTLNFQKYYADFSYFYTLLVGCLDTVNKYKEDVPDWLLNTLQGILLEYATRVEAMSHFSMDSLNSSPREFWNNITQENDKFLGRANSARNAYTNYSAVCDLIYVVSRLRDIKEIHEPGNADLSSVLSQSSTVLAEAKDALNQLNSDLKKTTVILSDVEQRASNIATNEYSEVFAGEAEKYSRWGGGNPRIGLSQIWISVGICAVIAVLVYINCTIITSDMVAHARDKDYDITRYLPSLISHVLIISILLFIIRFSFKQYSIAKHLYTINIHRANILRSFNLFIQGVGKDQPEVRNTLLIEVAKAIHPVGATGFIEDKSTEITMPLMEIFKTYTGGK